MNTKVITFFSRSFILFSALSLLAVSLMAFSNPQSVMDLVNVQLLNNDAVSSIRGVYGGVGLTIFISLIYLMVREPLKGLCFLSLLWGFYAFSRIVTISAEGSLGSFGTQWLYTETGLFVLALVLLFLNFQSRSSKDGEARSGN